jgi:hypothetical protein
MPLSDCTDNATRAGQDVIIVQGNRTKNSVLTVWACIPEEDRNNPDYTITYRYTRHTRHGTHDKYNTHTHTPHATTQHGTTQHDTCDIRAYMD